MKDGTMPLENALEAARRQVSTEIHQFAQEVCLDYDIEPHTLLLELSWETDN